MKMIIGGAYQGKLEFAKKVYPDMDWIDGTHCTEEELFTAEGVYNFHEYIKSQMKVKEETTNLAERLIENNPDVILVSDEVGYGIVPMDAFEREYRERVGRICTKLAAFSDTVHRVSCGIGMVIKDV